MPVLVFYQRVLRARIKVRSFAVFYLGFISVNNLSIIRACCLEYFVLAVGINHFCADWDVCGFVEVPSHWI